MLRTLLVGLLIDCSTAPTDPAVLSELQTAFPDLHRQVWPFTNHRWSASDCDDLAAVYARGSADAIHRTLDDPCKNGG